MFIICELKVGRIKYQKANFLINIVNLCYFNDKLFSIIALQLVFFFLPTYNMCFFFEVVKIISISAVFAEKLG